MTGLKLVHVDVPHITEFLAEEMEARGWTREVLAGLLLLERHKEEFARTMLELDLFFIVGPTTKKMLFNDEKAAELAAIFDVSSEFFTKLHAHWMEHGTVAARGPEGEGK